MCGLAGVIDFSGPVDRAPLKLMAEGLVHRGPDAEGFHFGDGVGLAFRRLSIVDLSTDANQPMISPDGRYVLVYNGEIYNYRELKAELERDGITFRTSGDSEVLLHWLIRRGPEGLADLNGMFAFLLWDDRKRTLLAARDRLGIKPLFYAVSSRGLVAASELGPMMASGLVDDEIDPAGLAAFFRYLFIPAPWTAYRAVKKLLPGHYLTFSEAAGLNIRRYWRPAPQAPDPEPRSEGEWQEAFTALFDDSVRIRLAADVPVGAFLSGGLDSSLVSAVAAANHDRFQTFCVTFPGQDRADEGAWAELASQRLGVELNACPLDFESWAGDLSRRLSFFGEPFAISSALALYSLCRLARTKVTVALGGDGGDEILAGYPTRHADDSVAWLSRILPRAAGRLIAGSPGKLGRLARALRMGDEAERYELRLTAQLDWDRDYLAPELAAALPEVTARFHDAYRAASGDRLTKRLITEIETTLPDEMLTKVDRMSMAHSLEARTPFLDHRLVELALALPRSLKLKGRTGKQVLRRMAAQRLPRGIDRRPKHGFNTPLAAWLGDGFEAKARALAAEAGLAEVGWFKPGAVENIMAAKTERGLFSLIALSLWRLNGL